MYNFAIKIVGIVCIISQLKLPGQQEEMAKKLNLKKIRYFVKYLIFLNLFYRDFKLVYKNTLS